jgi:hypothetical protein
LRVPDRLLAVHAAVDVPSYVRVTVRRAAETTMEPPAAGHAPAHFLKDVTVVVHERWPTFVSQVPPSVRQPVAAFHVTV